jgi:DNA-binding response OmpR family regulator
MAYTIMVVEDDEKIRELVSAELKRWGHQAVYPRGFKEVAEDVARERPQLVILDIGLPEYDGYHWCARIRQVSRVPILMLSARNSSPEMVMAMGMGADDYLAKPFTVDLLIAKVGALLRRSYDYARESSDFLERGGLLLDLGTCMARAGDKSAELTRNEFLILKRLMESPGQTVSRDSLASALWRDEIFVDDNTLSVNVNRLRGKLASLGLPEALRTIKGMGYLIP